MYRRQVIGMMAAGTAGGLAGCTGGGSDNGGEPTPSPTASPMSGGTSGASGGADTATPAATEADTDTPTQGAVTLGEIRVEFENNYRFTVDVSGAAEGADTTVSGDWYEGNFRSRIETDGEVLDSYLVDGTTYMVIDGSCTEVSSSGGASVGVDTEGLAGTERTADTVDTYGSIKARGRANIDGEEMYVFELPAEAGSGDEPTVYYVSVTTNRLRRVESQGATIDYYDWGEVDPIDAPC